MLRNVLIVDDSVINRRILKKILSEEYEVFEAQNGIEALEMLAHSADTFSAVLLDIMMPEMDGYTVLERMQHMPALSALPVIVTTGSTEEGAEVKALSLGANDFVTKPYNPEIIRHRLNNTIKLRETAAYVNTIQRDKLTGLYNREAFFVNVEQLVTEYPAGYFVLASTNINSFKTINDRYGSETGDAVLQHVANTFREEFSVVGGIVGRIMADHFAVLYPVSFIGSDALRKIWLLSSAVEGLEQPVTYNVGRYIVDDVTLPARAMYDRAALAGATIKGRYDIQTAEYTESMRSKILEEQEIVNHMNTALECGQFEIWLQPQFNHSSGALIGSEALVRWRHPDKGMVSPAAFIPVFERNGFVYELDKYVWEQACITLRRWLDRDAAPLPISVNMSRYDMLRDDFYEVITGLVEYYRVPKDLLRLEVTESAFASSASDMIRVVQDLIDYGFTVEIDDFGSGYSSLNTLKDVPANILKLDMRFLEGEENSSRGGNILESIVRMARWLGMPVIAEGVETNAQADYLRSIGCFYVQGYLYAKPMPVAEYEVLAAQSTKEPHMAGLETVGEMNNSSFWDPSSLDTLIFNSYVGGACIFEYHHNKLEMLRINEKYALELGVGMNMQEALEFDPAAHMDAENLSVMHQNIQQALAENKETFCELCMTIPERQNEKIWLRAALRPIARAGERVLLYCILTNITKQMEAEQRVRTLYEQMVAIVSNINGGLTASMKVGDKPKILFASQQYYALLGHTRESYLQEVKNPLDLILPADRPSAERDMLAAERANDSTVLVFRVMRRDGCIRWMRSSFSFVHLEGVSQPVRISVLNDITEDRERELENQEMTEHLRLLDIAVHNLLCKTIPDASVDGILLRVLDYYGGDRAYVFQIDWENRLVSNTYEVCGEGASCEIDNLQNLPIAAVPYWFHAFDDRDAIFIEDVGTLSGERTQEQAMLQEQGIESLVAVPMILDGQLIGFLGVDNPTRHQNHVERLKSIGDVMAAMLTRYALKKQLESVNQDRREEANA